MNKKIILFIGLIFMRLSAQEFEYSINAITPEIKSKMVYSWNDNSPVPLSDLRYITLLYYDFNKQVKKGELIIHYLAANDIVEIFKILFENKYPLGPICLVDRFRGEDSTSMKFNNSYAHCTRKVAHEDRWSNHAYGLAIDINPFYNPFIRGDYIEPKESKYYSDRSLNHVAMIKPDSLIYTLFKERGWQWGGECFNEYLDLHHFQKIIFGLNKTQN